MSGGVGDGGCGVIGDSCRRRLFRIVRSIVIVHMQIRIMCIRTIAAESASSLPIVPANLFAIFHLRMGVAVHLRARKMDVRAILMDVRAIGELRSCEHTEESMCAVPFSRASPN